MSAQCPCSRAPALPGRFSCASCEARRTPPVRTPSPPRTLGFVLAPPVAPSPPRRMPPLPELIEADLRSRVLAADVPCVTLGRDRTAHVGRTGVARTAAHVGLCGRCINALRAAAEKRARLRRHGVAA